MSKLSTKQILANIPDWFTRDILPGYGRGQTKIVDCVSTYERPSDPKVSTLKQLQAEFLNPKRWARDEKHRADEVEQSKYDDPGAAAYAHKGKRIADNGDDPLINLDMGDVAGDLLEKALILYRDTGKRPWVRVFCPKNEDLADNWRLEVLTDHDDQHIIAWSAVID